jgi:hypothetical protein
MKRYKIHYQILVNGRDYPIYYGKEEMFEATNQMIFPHIPTTDYQK